MSEQLQNLRTLLSVGEDILAKRLPFHFGSWTFATPCGTFGCLLGQYGASKGVTVCNTMSVSRLKLNLLAPFIYAMDEFGMTKAYALAFFRSGIDAGCPSADFIGSAAYAELERRLGYLRTMIAERESAEKPTTDAIPESVRAIFETQQTTMVC